MRDLVQKGSGASETDVDSGVLVVGAGALAHEAR